MTVTCSLQNCGFVLTKGLGQDRNSALLPASVFSHWRSFSLINTNEWLLLLHSPIHLYGKRWRDYFQVNHTTDGKVKQCISSYCAKILRNPDFKKVFFIPWKGIQFLWLFFKVLYSFFMLLKGARWSLSLWGSYGGWAVCMSSCYTFLQLFAASLATVLPDLQKPHRIN